MVRGRTWQPHPTKGVFRTGAAKKKPATITTSEYDERGPRCLVSWLGRDGNDATLPTHSWGDVRQAEHSQSPKSASSESFLRSVGMGPPRRSHSFGWRSTCCYCLVIASLKMS